MRMFLARALVLGLVGAAGWLSYSVIRAGILSRPPSYRAAVMRLLDQRGVSYRDVVVNDGCAPTYQRCRTYAGAVQVQAEVELQGQIACRGRWTSCVLTIADT